MRNTLKHMAEYTILFLIGGVFYYLTEMVARGYSHWTMFLTGACVFLLIGLENQRFQWKWALTSQMLLACITITICEFVVGVVLNMGFDMNVWDYSHKPYNLYGQICLLNSVLWFFYSIIPIVVDDYLRYWWFGEEKPHYKIL